MIEQSRNHILMWTLSLLALSRAPGWLSLSLWIAVSRENRPSLKGGGLRLPLRHTPREAGASAKEFIWSFADVFISMYTNKINLIFKTGSFIKLKRPQAAMQSSDLSLRKLHSQVEMVKGWYESFPWMQSLRLPGVAGTIWNTHNYFTFLLFLLFIYLFSIKSISFGSELCWIDQFHVNSLKYFKYINISSSFFIFKDTWTQLP